MPDRRVEPLADQVDQPVAVGGADLEPRVAHGELGQHRREVRVPERDRRGDAQPPARLALAAERVAPRLQLGHHPLGIGAEVAARLGQRHAAGGPRQQRGAELGLEPRQPAADHRLRHAEPRPGAGQAAAVGHLAEGADVVEIGHLPFRILQKSLRHPAATVAGFATAYSAGHATNPDKDRTHEHHSRHRQRRQRRRIGLPPARPRGGRRPDRARDLARDLPRPRHRAGAAPDRSHRRRRPRRAGDRGRARCRARSPTR